MSVACESMGPKYLASKLISQEEISKTNL